MNTTRYIKIYSARPIPVARYNIVPDLRNLLSSTLEVESHGAMVLEDIETLFLSHFSEREFSNKKRNRMFGAVIDTPRQRGSITILWQSTIEQKIQMPRKIHGKIQNVSSHDRLTNVYSISTCGKLSRSLGRVHGKNFEQLVRFHGSSCLRVL